MVCSNCHGPLEPGLTRCPGCGALLVSKEELERRMQAAPMPAPAPVAPVPAPSPIVSPTPVVAETPIPMPTPAPEPPKPQVVQVNRVTKVVTQPTVVKIRKVETIPTGQVVQPQPPVEKPEVIEELPSVTPEIAPVAPSVVEQPSAPVEELEALEPTPVEAPVPQVPPMPEVPPVPQIVEQSNESLENLMQQPEEVQVAPPVDPLTPIEITNQTEVQPVAPVQQETILTAPGVEPFTPIEELAPVAPVTPVAPEVPVPSPVEVAPAPAEPAPLPVEQVAPVAPVEPAPTEPVPVQPEPAPMPVPEPIPEPVQEPPEAPVEQAIPNILPSDVVPQEEPPKEELPINPILPPILPGESIFPKEEEDEPEKPVEPEPKPEENTEIKPEDSETSTESGETPAEGEAPADGTVVIDAEHPEEKYDPLKMAQIKHERKVLLQVFLIVVCIIGGAYISKVYFPIKKVETIRTGRDLEAEKISSDGIKNIVRSGDFVFAIPMEYLYDKRENGLIITNETNDWSIYIRSVKQKYKIFQDSKDKITTFLINNLFTVHNNGGVIKHVGEEAEYIEYVVTAPLNTKDEEGNNEKITKLIAIKDADEARESTVFYIEIMLYDKELGEKIKEFDTYADVLEICNDIINQSTYTKEQASIEQVGLTDEYELIISAAEAYNAYSTTSDK